MCVHDAHRARLQRDSSVVSLRERGYLAIFFHWVKCQTRKSGAARACALRTKEIHIHSLRPWFSWHAKGGRVGFPSRGSSFDGQLRQCRVLCKTERKTRKRKWNATARRFRLLSTELTTQRNLFWRNPTVKTPLCISLHPPPPFFLLFLSQFFSFFLFFSFFFLVEMWHSCSRGLSSVDGFVWEMWHDRFLECWQRKPRN